MTTNTQPDALRLADIAEPQGDWPFPINYEDRKAIAAELRRLHAEVEKLRQAQGGEAVAWRFITRHGHKSSWRDFDPVQDPSNQKYAELSGGGRIEYAYTSPPLQADACKVPQEVLVALADAQEFINDVHYGEWPGPGGRRNAVHVQLAKAFALLSAAPTQVETQWQPIETAPKDGSLIVARGNNYNQADLGQHHCIACWYRGCWMEASDWNETSELLYLTHWMPLPAAPSTPLI